jgi:hypothetical protein
VQERQEVALVVRRAPRIHATVADLGLEGRREKPSLEEPIHPDIFVWS